MRVCRFRDFAASAGKASGGSRVKFVVVAVVEDVASISGKTVPFLTSKSFHNILSRWLELLLWLRGTSKKNSFGDSFVFQRLTRRGTRRPFISIWLP